MSESTDSNPKHVGAEAEQRLLELAWKENLGSLTTGLIHDFCNIMTGFISLSETLEEEPNGNETVRNSLNLIRKTALEASQLAHRVRRLYQEVPGEKSFLDLNELVSNLTALLQKLLSRRVTLQLSLARGQLPLYADAVELQQVIAGLVLSAVREMRETGRIMIRTTLHDAVHGLAHTPKELPRPPIICLSIEAPVKGIFAPANSALDSILSNNSSFAAFHAKKCAEKHEAVISFEPGDSSSTIRLWFAQANLEEPQNGAQ